ncbi:hypothetical protein VQ042_09835 [Aurantimonas sp. A2-1-M11]|uniref:hypothetical protein n=1 Tax=Aurantimonas sp. A2-1-M11 TaxID=3113712 RepID=UPI002F92D799
MHILPSERSSANVQESTMSTITAAKEPTPDMTDFLTEELSRDFADRTQKPVTASNVLSGPPLIVEEPVPRLPRRIDGGFAGLGHDLDKHGRECRNAVRLMEQLRPQLEAAEAERARLSQALARIMPEIEENGRGLSGMIENARKGDVSGDLTAKFTKSAAKLDELENLSEALNVNLMAVRSAWEQYARAAIQAQRLRDGLKGH